VKDTDLQVDPLFGTCSWRTHRRKGIGMGAGFRSRSRRHRTD